MRLIIFEREERYIDVAKRGQNERVMDANTIGEHALQLWNNRAAHNGADQQSGAFAR